MTSYIIKVDVVVEGGSGIEAERGLAGALANMVGGEIRDFDILETQEAPAEKGGN